MNHTLFDRLRQLWYKLPFRVRLRLVGAAYRPLAIFDSIRGKPQRSPHRLLVGYGDFDAIGETTVSLLSEITGLRPEHDILDMGSGVGRTAIPLTRFLSTEARYEGFDIVPEFVSWCRSEISANHPNFTFQLIDAANSEYNREGGLDPARLQFPYEDNSFDVAYAGSLFTHLMPAATANYLRELARVLRPGGSALLTFFLVDDDPEENYRRSRMTLVAGPEDTLVLDPNNPEADVAHRTSWVERTLRESGFESIEIHPGSWSGRTPALEYQDLVVASLPAEPPSADTLGE